MFPSAGSDSEEEGSGKEEEEKEEESSDSDSESQGESAEEVDEELRSKVKAALGKGAVCVDEVGGVGQSSVSRES